MSAGAAWPCFGAAGPAVKNNANANAVEYNANAAAINAAFANNNNKLKKQKRNMKSPKNYEILQIMLE